jgi:hypothetical protein
MATTECSDLPYILQGLYYSIKTVRPNQHPTYVPHCKHLLPIQRTPAQYLSWDMLLQCTFYLSTRNIYLLQWTADLPDILRTWATVATYVQCVIVNCLQNSTFSVLGQDISTVCSV